MKKKVFSFLIACVAFLVSYSADAQNSPKVPRVGLFHVGLDHVPPSFPALRDALKKLGYIEGKNIHLDWRNLADEQAARETAKEFDRLPVDLMVPFEDQSIRAAKAVKASVPILFLHANDPVVDGYVKSFARPGGNMTGFVVWPVSYGKQVELFTEIIPDLRRLLLLIHPNDPVGQRWLKEVQQTGEALKLRLIEREATNEAEITRVIKSVKRDEVDGVLVPSLILRNSHSSLITRLASEQRLPLGMHRKEWVERGALFSYSADLASVGSAAAIYVDKMLKGTKPADLPVDQVSRFELVFNLISARNLGLTIPQSVLFRATRVIR